MKYIILSILLITFIQAEDTKPVPQPLEVIKALSEFEKGVTSARKIYDIETTKLSGKALEQLEKAKLSYMQKGDLEGANLVSAAIKKLNEGEILTAIEGNIKKQVGIFGDLERMAVIGKWIGPGWDTDIKPDGTVNTAGKWEIVGNKLILSWKGNGTVCTFNLPIKNNTLSGSNNKGTSLTITKVVAK